MFLAGRMWPACWMLPSIQFHQHFTSSLYANFLAPKTVKPTECFIDLGKLNLLKISLPWSKSVKQTVDSKYRNAACFFDICTKKLHMKFCSGEITC